jgi:hypothetical protein
MLLGFRNIVGLDRAISELPSSYRGAADEAVHAFLTGKKGAEVGSGERGQLLLDGEHLHSGVVVNVKIDKFMFIIFIYTKHGFRSAIVIRSRLAIVHHMLRQ